MAVATVDESWFEVTPRRRLDGNMPISRLMATSAEAAATGARWPRLLSVSALATVYEAAHLMASRGCNRFRCATRAMVRSWACCR